MSKSSSSLWIVLLIIFFDWMGIGIVYPMFSTMLFSTEGPLYNPHNSEALRGIYLGVLLAAMPIAQFFSGPILGTISDQKGRKPLFIVSLILAVIAYGFSTIGVIYESIAILIGSRFLIGIAAGNAAVVTATIADLSDATNKAKHYGLYSMACGTGFTIGPLVGGKLSEISFTIPFIVAGLGTFLNLFLLFFLMTETHKTRKKSEIRIGEGIRNLKKAFKTPGLKTLFITVLLFCFGWSFFFEFLPVAWIFDFNLKSGDIGILYAYGAAFYAVSSGILIRPIVARYKNGAVLFYGLLGLGIIFLFILLPLKYYWVWIYLPLINFLSALIFPTSTTMVSNSASDETQGETLGILASVQSAAFGLSPLLGGAILGNNPHMPMAIGSITMLTGAVILGLMIRKDILSPRNKV
jgi:DHA1 family tetracycline resistance protein-like MFS transporter